MKSSSPFWILASGFLLAAISLPSTSNAGPLAVDQPFGEHMILQRSAVNTLTGTTSPDTEISIDFLDQKKTSRSDTAGKWRIPLEIPDRPGGPYPMTISSGEAQLKYADILVGDIWLASGQSNMVWTVTGSSNGREEAANAENPKIRLLQMPRRGALEPLADIPVDWMPCTPKNVALFSGAAYFFGREIAAATGIPIGLIQAAWSGKRAEPFIRKEALAANPLYDTTLKGLAIRGKPETQEKLKADYEAKLAEWEKAADQPRPRKPSPGKGSVMSGELPTTIWNGMIHPLVQIPITGVIWYQGESNARSAADYVTTLTTLITDWRTQWNREFPFYIVQLANFRPVKPEPSDSDWAALREAQAKVAADVPKSGLAVIIESGQADHIHPPRKQPVGHRLALQALKKHYGKDLQADSPSLDSYEIQGGTALVKFRNAEHLKTTDGQEVKGFALAGPDQVFHWARGAIDGATVRLTCEKVPAPRAIRYAWADNPETNLYNEADLPAVPFRTDDWPQSVTEKETPEATGSSE